MEAVDTSEPTLLHAPFVVVYTAADASGRASAPATRNVTVVSPCAPPSYLCPPPSTACARCGAGDGGSGDACVCLSALVELTGDVDVVLAAYEPPVDTAPPVLTVRMGEDGVYARTPSGVVVVVHTVRLPPITIRIGHGGASACLCTSGDRLLAHTPSQPASQCFRTLCFLCCWR